MTAGLPVRRLPDRVEVHSRAAATSNYRRDIIVAVGMHWFRSNQPTFNLIVSRAVPKSGRLAELEAVAGRAIRPPATDRLASSMRRMVETNSNRYSDGWEEGDFWACYDFPDGNRWWFQVRNGRLVNYDPAVLASQPQPRRPDAIR